LIVSGKFLSDDTYELILYMYMLPSMRSQPEHHHALLEKTGIYVNACPTSIEQPWNSLVFACHFGYIHLTL